MQRSFDLKKMEIKEIWAHRFLLETFYKNDHTHKLNDIVVSYKNRLIVHTSFYSRVKVSFCNKTLNLNMSL